MPQGQIRKPPLVHVVTETAGQALVTQIHGLNLRKLNPLLQLPPTTSQMARDLLRRIVWSTKQTIQ